LLVLIWILFSSLICLFVYCKVNDIALSTLLKILRISGTLEGVVGLVPELPDSPFLINEKTGKRIQRINSKRKMA